MADLPRCPGRREVPDSLGTVCIPQECMECGRREDIDAEGLQWIAPQDEPCANRIPELGRSEPEMGTPGVTTCRPVRLLTREEACDAYAGVPWLNDGATSPDFMDRINAVQRKLLEVNGLAVTHGVGGNDGR